MAEKNIFLIGFMGVGKSTIAGELAEKLGAEVVEMDARLVEEAGMSINEIFAKYGENGFRDRESRLVEVLAGLNNLVVSCGGGAILRQENVDNMKKNGRIVLLTAKPETIYERVKEDTDRPLLKGHMNVEYITQMMASRLPKYQAAADFSVPTDGRSVKEICEDILKRGNSYEQDI